MEESIALFMCHITSAKRSKSSEKISAVVITLNEERRLANCLDSVKWMDEIIVVDSGSTDGTYGIARKYTEQVFYRQFDNYAYQKNYGADKASHDWIFSIDADEVMSSELRRELKQLLTARPAWGSYGVHRHNIYFAHTVRHVFGVDEPVRLYRRSQAHFEGAVHEKISGPAPGSLKSPLIHYSCESFLEWVHKHRHYTRLHAEKEFFNGRRFSFMKLILSPFRVFWLRAVVLQGWRDGWAGLAIAGEMSLSAALFQLELRKLDRRKQRREASC